MKPVLARLAEALGGEIANTEAFRRQLRELLAGGSSAAFLERLEKGCAYYRAFLAGLLERLLRQREPVRARKRQNAYVARVAELDTALSKKLEAVDRVAALAAGILEGRHQFPVEAFARRREEARAALLARVEQARAKPASERAGNARSGGRQAKGSEPRTHEVTLEMFRRGLGAGQIADQRGLTVGTIESHLAKAVEGGRLEIGAVVTPAELSEIGAAMEALPAGHGGKELFAALEGRFSYGKLRAAMAHRKSLLAAGEV
jgi:hypothetical protein